MIVWLMHELREYFPPLRVFRYVSFRVIMAMLTSLTIYVLHPWFIRRLQSRQIGQVVRKDGRNLTLVKLARQPWVVHWSYFRS